MDDNCTITLIDGDSYELKNYERQCFSNLGNKADVKKKELEMGYELKFESINQFVTKENISNIIQEEDVIFLCVDNHATRKLVSEYSNTLKNIAIISGGNELMDGNVQIYIRKNGEEITPSLTAYHPEIMNPTDKSPNEMSCEELSQVTPQLFFTNLTVATLMCWAFFHAIVRKEEQLDSEIYFDIMEMSVLSKSRKVKKAA
jgi:molybdopterin/thiamine biosynthesis adenylyltransferase